MSRKPDTYPEEKVALAVWLLARGVSDREAASITGIPRSIVLRRKGTAWADRIDVERKSPTTDPRKASGPSFPVALISAGAADPDEEPDEPADFSVGATLAEIDHWLAIAKQRAEAASASDNPKAHAEYMRMIIQLLEARRKAAPPPTIDPNDSPDMVENAAKVRKIWHDKAAALFRVANSPLAVTIGKILRGEIKKT